jgi:hypothetical protein
VLKGNEEWRIVFLGLSGGSTFLSKKEKIKTFWSPDLTFKPKC